MGRRGGWRVSVVALVAVVVVVRRSDEPEPRTAHVAERAFCRPADLVLSLETQPLNSAQTQHYFSVRNRGNALCTVGAVLTVGIDPGTLGPIVVESALGDVIEPARSASDRVTLVPDGRAYAGLIVHDFCEVVGAPYASIGVRLSVRTSTQTKWTSARLRVPTCPRGTRLELGSLQLAQAQR